jgi:hypothetical protein
MVVYIVYNFVNTKKILDEKKIKIKINKNIKKIKCIVSTKLTKIYITVTKLM